MSDRLSPKKTISHRHTWEDLNSIDSSGQATAEIRQPLNTEQGFRIV